MTKATLHLDWSSKDYHEHPAVSRSDLWRFKRSPIAYSYGKEHRSESTPSIILGELVHTMFLEPHELHKRFVVDTIENKRTNAGKLEYENLKTFAQTNGLNIMDEKTMKLGIDIIESLERYCSHHELDFLKGAAVEASILFEHQNGIMCKARPDIMVNNIVVDLKTTMDASYSAFQRSCSNYGYYLQAGMMYEAYKAMDRKLEAFMFLCVETKAPHACAVYKLSDDAIDYGVGLFNDLIESFKECRDNNRMNAHYPIRELGVPKWLLNAMEDFDYE